MELTQKVADEVRPLPDTNGGSVTFKPFGCQPEGFVYYDNY